MSSWNGAIIGAANVPTRSAAPGVWRPSRIAQILATSVNSEPVWPVAADPQFANVVGLYRGEATQSALSTGALHDYSSAANNLSLRAACISIKSIGKFGPFTMSNDGTGGWGYNLADSDFNLSTGDFTIEGWWYFNDGTRFTNLMDFRASDNSGIGPILVRNGSNKVVFYSSGAGANITGATNVTATTWHHIHATRASGTTYLGLDGGQQGSDYTDSNNYTGGNLWLNMDAGVTGTQNLYGMWQQVRITKGFARYSRTYTVPTAPFPEY